MSVMPGLSGTKAMVSGFGGTILPDGFIWRCSVCARISFACICAPSGNTVVAPERGVAFGAGEYAVKK